MSFEYEWALYTSILNVYRLCLQLQYTRIYWRNCQGQSWNRSSTNTWDPQYVRRSVNLQPAVKRRNNCEARGLWTGGDIATSLGMGEREHRIEMVMRLLWPNSRALVTCTEFYGCVWQVNGTFEGQQGYLYIHVFVSLDSEIMMNEWHRTGVNCFEIFVANNRKMIWQNEHTWK